MADIPAADESEWGHSAELTDEERANLAAFAGVFPHWNNHDVQRMLAFYDEDVTWHNIAMDEVYRGKDAVRGFLERLFTGIPDLQLDVQLRLPRGRYVAEKYMIRGHHRGKLWGVPPTGRWLDLQCISIVELRGGKLKEDRFYFDAAAALRQMGLLPDFHVGQTPLGHAALLVAVGTRQAVGRIADRTGGWLTQLGGARRRGTG